MTNADTATALRIARRNLDRADSALSSALYRDDVRAIVPKVPRTCPVTGRLHSNETDEWHAVTYGGSAKQIAAFRRAAPAAAALIATELDARLAALAAYETARKVDKAAKDARRAAKAAKAAEKALNPARPLASINPVAAVNYDVLSATFATRREAFVTACVEAAVRRSGGRVMANVNEKIEAESAGASFDGYMAKLATKIEAKVTTATLGGGSLWGWSFLTVETDAGQQVWNTQMIINYSGLGNAFNQWPTRRVS